MPVILDNPVLNGLIAGIQERRQAEAQKAAIENQKSEIEARKAATAQGQQHLDAYIQNLKHEQDLANANLEIQKSRLSQEKTAHELQARKTLSELIASGAYHPGQGPLAQATLGGQIQQTQNPGAPGPVVDLNNLPSRSTTVQPTLNITPGTPSQPIQIGDMTINPDDFAKPEELQQLHEQQMRKMGAIQADIAGAEAGAKAKAEEPFKLRELGVKGEQAQTIEQMKAQLAKENNERTNTSRENAARIHAGATIFAQQMKLKADEGEQISNLATLHAVGADPAPLPNTKIGTATKLAMAKQGFVDISNKRITDLQNVNKLKPLYGEMAKYINQLPDNWVGGRMQSIAGMIPGTDTNEFKKRITAMAGNISREMGGEAGRLTEDDIKRGVGLLVQPGITKAQAIERLKFLQANTTNRVMDVYLNGVPQKQKLLILQHHGFDPAQYSPDVNYGGKVYSLYQQNPQNGEWGVFNTKTGKVDPITTGVQ